MFLNIIGKACGGTLNVQRLLTGCLEGMVGQYSLELACGLAPLERQEMMVVRECNDEEKGM